MLEGVPADQNGVAPARDDLEALVAYSLVGLSTPEGSETPRVRLHPLVRELAREEWAGQAEAIQTGVLRGLLVGIGDWLSTHQGQSPATFIALARDEDLIAGALRTATTRRIELPHVASIITAWTDYLAYRSLSLALEMHTLHVEAARALGDRRGELLALSSLTRISHYIRPTEETQRYERAGLALARELGDQVLVLKFLGALVSDMSDQQRGEQGAQLYEEASVIAREMGDRLTDASTLINLGNLAYKTGHLDEAGRWWRQAESNAHTTGNVLTEKLAAFNLAELAERTGDTAAARQAYEELLAFARQFGIQFSIGMGLNALGQLALAEGDLETASRYLSEALPCSSRTAAAGW